jgi:two-component system sensor histidine kinase PilS (NtrC family)
MARPSPGRPSRRGWWRARSSSGWRVFVSRRCGYADARTTQVRRLAEILFKNLPAGLMLLDSDDRIVLANDRACELFRQTEHTLQNHRLVDLLAPGAEERPWGSAAQSASAHRFRRLDGSMFPAHVETGRVCLSGDLVHGGGDADFTVVTLTDISRLLEMQRRIQDKERLRTAASMATQIAHEVRNPVAAISGSAQVLDKLEKGSKAGDTVSDALLGTERTRLYDCIVSESSRLDEIIAKFLSVTEFSEEKLQLLLRMAEEAQPPTPRRAPEVAKQAAADTAA